MNETILLSALAAHEREGVDEGFPAAMERLARSLPLRRAAWLAAGGDPRLLWPPSADTAGLPEPGRDAEPFQIDSARGGAWVVLPSLGPERRDHVVIEMEEPGEYVRLEGWEDLRRAFQLLTRRESRRSEEADAQQRLRARIDQAEALQVLGVMINATLDLPDVLEAVGRFVRTLFGAHGAAIYLSQREELRERYAVGEHTPGIQRFAEEVVRGGRTRVERGGAPESLTAGELDGGLLGIPLLRADEILGVLVLVYRGGRVPGEGEIRVASAVATNAAVAVANAHLHHELEQRGRELSELNERLREQSQVKERFFASVNHELRTPLTAVLGYQELILDGVAGPVPGPVLDFVRRARVATGDLLGLVNDILDMSRIHAGRMELEVEEVGVREVVLGARSTVETIAIAKDIDFPRPEVDRRLRVHADPGRLRQILLNLLSNAVKFTTAGSVRITAEADARWVMIHVIDTGPGIPADARDRIFEEFEQVRGPKYRAGTGLGLAISRQLARLMEGDVTVAGDPDGGSRFTIRLPRAIGR